MKRLLSLLFVLVLLIGVSMPNVVHAEETHYFRFKEASDSMTIKVFDPLTLTVEKINGSAVYTDVTYTWYLCSTKIDPAEIEKAKDKDKLYLPSFNFVTDNTDITGIQCEIFFSENGTPYHDVIDLTLDIDYSLMEENKGKVILVGGYTVKQGQTFDLANPDEAHDAPALGKGTISLNEKGDEVTLNSVEFVYDPDNLPVDRIFLFDYGFAYYTFNNDLENININVVGENKITNNFHLDFVDEDGTTFFMGITSDGSSEVVIDPTYNLVGSGSLEVNGGLYGILAQGDLNVDTNVSVNGTKDENYPGRCGNGITGGNVIIGSNANVKLNVAGNGIQANIASSDDGFGKIEFKPGSKADITITNYVRHPFKEQGVPSMSSGIKSANVMTINGADIKISMTADKGINDDYNTKYPDQAPAAFPYCLDGIANEGKDTPYNLLISNSNIDITCKVISDDDVPFLDYSRGIMFDDAADDEGDSRVIINNSKINMNINDTANIGSATGIETDNIDLTDSTVNINVGSKNKSYGMYMKKLSFITRTTRKELNVKNSDVKINSSCIGVIGEAMNFDYGNSDKKFIVNADRLGIVSWLQENGEERYYEEGYAVKNIKLGRNTVEDASKPKNMYSSSSNLYYSEEGPSVDERLKALNNLLNDPAENVLDSLEYSPFKVFRNDDGSIPDGAKERFDAFRKQSLTYRESKRDEAARYLRYARFTDEIDADEPEFFHYETFYNRDKKTVAGNVIIERLYIPNTSTK